jgi:pantothenate kinase
VEPVKPVYSDIKVIISTVIPIVISSSSSVETPAQGGDIIRPIVYSDLSTNKKAEYQEKRSRFRILEKDYNKKVDTLANIIKNIQTSIVENWIHLLIRQTTAYDMLCILREQFGPIDLVRENEIVI